MTTSAPAEIARELVRGERRIEYVALQDIVGAARNPKLHAEADLDKSMGRFGYTEPVIMDERTGRLVAGHGRIGSLVRLRDKGGAPPEGVQASIQGHWLVPVVRGWASRSDSDAEAYLLASNQLTIAGGWDDEQLKELLAELSADQALEGTGFDEKLLARLIQSTAPAGPSLSEKFVIPPFSVLDARKGYWQERKRMWLALGIQSEIGRGENLLAINPGLHGEDYRESKVNGFGTKGMAFSGGTLKGEHNGHLDEGAKRSLGSYAAYGAAGAVERAGGGVTGTSIFDPVLCEIACRWFIPHGLSGVVLDPFAGGSVRGVIASKLGHQYIGVDLRQEQVEANRAQWEEIQRKGAATVVEATARAADADDYTPELTPIEERGQYWVKRDDLFCIAGIRGGKVRSCWALARGAKGLVTAGARHSPQVSIVARIGARLGIPVRAHVPDGEPGPELVDAEEHGAELVAHTPGYNTVIVARAREDAAARAAEGWREIPFGMECAEAVKQTRAQVREIPSGVRRIVVPVGSGMSLSGVLWGLKDAGLQLPVLGVRVGADPSKRLKEFAPPEWRSMVTLVESPLKYGQSASARSLEGLQLDPIYEAKCLEFLQPGDLLWVVGIRAEHQAPSTAGATAAPAPRWICGDSQNIRTLVEGTEADLVFTCPPYGDLEVYSADPADISTLEADEFDKAFAAIVKESLRLLRHNRFAVCVVGDYRDSKGLYRNFVSKTIAAFEAGGARLYNEAILVTSVGTLRLRVGHHFGKGRKLGKSHQNVLVFWKGDPGAVAETMGEVEIPKEALDNARDPLEEEEAV